MPGQLTLSELAKMERMKHGGSTAKDILRGLRRARAQRGESGPGRTTVYDFLRGKTFVRGAPEKRGAKVKLTPNILRVLNQVRQRLQKTADSQLHSQKTMTP